MYYNIVLLITLNKKVNKSIDYITFCILLYIHTLSKFIIIDIYLKI